MIKYNFIGKRFGKLTVVSEALTRRRKNGTSSRYWNCVCDCGGTKEARTSGLTRKTTVTISCGCVNRERCKAAIGPASYNWKGGIVYDDYGYKLIRIPNHHRAKSNGYVREHIVNMEEKLGRRLITGEEVHHLNGVKDDNRPENLELWLTSQPPGQRIIDLVNWAKEILKRYGENDNLCGSSG